MRMGRILSQVTLTLALLGSAHAAWYDFFNPLNKIRPVARQDSLSGLGGIQGYEGLGAPPNDGHKYEQYWEDEAVETSEIEFGDWITHIEETAEPIWYTEHTMEPIYEEIWESPEPEWEYVDEWIYESDEPDFEDYSELPEKFDIEGLDLSALDGQPKQENTPSLDPTELEGLADSLLDDEDTTNKTKEKGSLGSPELNKLFGESMLSDDNSDSDDDLPLIGNSLPASLFGNGDNQSLPKIPL